MTNTTYAVYVEPAREGVKFRGWVRPSYKTPQEAVSTANRLLNEHPFEFKANDFTFREEGKRPFASIFAEKWRYRMYDMLFQRAIALAGLLGVITIVSGIAVAYMGGNAVGVWNIGFLTSAVIALVGAIPALARTLKDVRNYGGLDDYLEGYDS